MTNLSLYRRKPLELPVDERDVLTLKAVYAGKGSADDQTRAFEIIMKKLCNIGGISFDEDPHVTALNEGKRLVGLQLLYLINEPTEKLFKPKKETKNDRQSGK